MNLVRNKWTQEDMVEFQKILESESNKERVEWTKKIINTKYECLAIPSKRIKQIVNEIAKGDFLSFLLCNLPITYDNLAISGYLIPKIDNFDLMKKHLYDYVEVVDNWANCDLLKFKINSENKAKYFDLANELLGNEKPFVRRCGLVILFKFLDDDYIDRVLDICNHFEKEKEYYVNMCVAWLMCDAFIKQRDKVEDFLKTHKLNDFVINKFVSKCRDSYRVSDLDKQMLLQYRV